MAAVHSEYEAFLRDYHRRIDSAEFGDETSRTRARCHRTAHVLACMNDWLRLVFEQGYSVWIDDMDLAVIAERPGTASPTADSESPPVADVRAFPLDRRDAHRARMQVDLALKYFPDPDLNRRELESWIGVICTSSYVFLD